MRKFGSEKCMELHPVRKQGGSSFRSKTHSNTDIFYQDLNKALQVIYKEMEPFGAQPTNRNAFPFCLLPWSLYAFSN